MLSGLPRRPGDSHRTLERAIIKVLISNLVIKVLQVALSRISSIRSSLYGLALCAALHTTITSEPGQRRRSFDGFQSKLGKIRINNRCNSLNEVMSPAFRHYLVGFTDFRRPRFYYKTMAQCRIPKYIISDEFYLPAVLLELALSSPHSLDFLVVQSSPLIIEF